MHSKRRIDALKGALKGRKLESILVTDETNVSYLSGFAGHDAVLIITGEENFFITDSRYVEEAREALRGFKIDVIGRTTYDSIRSIVKKQRIGSIGFESMNLPYGAAKKLLGAIGDTKLVPTKGVVEELRRVKDAFEIAKIKDSVRLTRSVMANISGSLNPGMSEADVARNIEIMFIKGGARPSFDPIVASGANSSKPHAQPGMQRMQKNSAVMIDIGCTLKGYCSDITRMFFLGRVAGRFKKIYGIVSAAQRYAIDMIKPGAAISSIDRAAREHISKKGFGKRFGHSLGHGVGMKVHEEPSISRASEGRLKAGMIFTVEPAIYIPKFGGVRIEDMVLVTDNGCEILTK